MCLQNGRLILGHSGTLPLGLSGAPHMRQPTRVSPEDPPIPYDQNIAKGIQTAAQRARGAVMLRAKRRGAGTVIGGFSVAGSSKMLFPHGPAAGPLTGVWLNTAGGITGGDQFDLSATAEDGSHLILTSQAAERIYRAMPGAPGQVVNRLDVSSGARIDWVPQETILFDQSALDRRLDVTMTSDARFLGVETLIFGRALMGETVTQLDLMDRISLRRDGTLVFADRLRLSGDAHAALSRAHLGDGAGAMATVICAWRGASAQLDALRDMLSDTAGVSALDDDLIVLRMVAPDGFDLRQTLIPVLRHLNGADLPRPWMI